MFDKKFLLVAGDCWRLWVWRGVARLAAKNRAPGIHSYLARTILATDLPLLRQYVWAAATSAKAIPPLPGSATSS